MKNLEKKKMVRMQQAYGAQKLMKYKHDRNEEFKKNHQEKVAKEK